MTTASAAVASAASLLLSVLCAINYRGCMLRLAELIDRRLLLGVLGRAMRSRRDRPTFWVLRFIGLWSAISSMSSLAALAAR